MKEKQRYRSLQLVRCKMVDRRSLVGQRRVRGAARTTSHRAASASVSKTTGRLRQPRPEKFIVVVQRRLHVFDSIYK